MKRIVLILACSAFSFLYHVSALAQNTSGDAVFTDWLAWVEKVPVSDWSGPADLEPRYRAVLISRGVHPLAADEQIKAIREKIIAGWPEWSRMAYNKSYRMPQPQFRTEPNAFLQRIASKLKPGKALDVAMGQGRNTIWLAQQGWDVTGYDPADQGVEIANEKAKQLGVKIRGVVSRMEEFDHGRDQWDLIVMTYALDKRSLPPIRTALKAGGVLVLENFYRDYVGGFQHPAMTGPNELLNMFRDFRILYYEEARGPSDWGAKGPSENAAIVRLAAQKPVSN